MPASPTTCPRSRGVRHGHLWDIAYWSSLWPIDFYVVLASSEGGTWRDWDAVGQGYCCTTAKLYFGIAVCLSCAHPRFSCVPTWCRHAFCILPQGIGTGAQETHAPRVALHFEKAWAIAFCLPRPHLAQQCPVAPCSTPLHTHLGLPCCALRHSLP